MSKRPRLPKSSKTTDHNSSSEHDYEYEVGRGKPPIHTRWRPGQSGNPRGRPKHSRNLSTVVQRALDQRISVREGDCARSLTKMEAIVLTMVNKALQGDLKFLLGIIRLMQSLGSIQEIPPELNTDPLTDSHADVIADFLRGYGISIDSGTSAIERKSAPADKRRKP